MCTPSVYECSEKPVVLAGLKDIADLVSTDGVEVLVVATDFFPLYEMNEKRRKYQITGKYGEKETRDGTLNHGLINHCKLAGIHRLGGLVCSTFSTENVRDIPDFRVPSNTYEMESANRKQSQ